METRRRAGQQSDVGVSGIVRYEGLRGDWVKGADLVARLIAQSSKKKISLQGFPRQWIPLFIHFGAIWAESTRGIGYTPIASDLSEEEVARLSRGAQSENALREMVEAFASLDPLVADVLHKLDRRMVRAEEPPPGRVKLTGWQSYGRPDVLALNALVAQMAHADHSTAVLLPCARKRPYQESKTHKRIWAKLRERSIRTENVDQLVVSSIGIVPEKLWGHPVVTAYDSGVPDIYRVLRLMRIYFARARFDKIIDCLEFKPYSDCLQIVAREGLVGSVQVIPCGRKKPLPQP